MKTLDDIERHAFADGDTKTVAPVQQMQDVIDEEVGGVFTEEAYDRGYQSGINQSRDQADYDELERKYNTYHTLLVQLRTALAAAGAFDRKDWLRRVRSVL